MTNEIIEELTKIARNLRWRIMQVKPLDRAQIEKIEAVRYEIIKLNDLIDKINKELE